MGPASMDDIDCGGFFDQIDDLVDNALLGCNDFPSIWDEELPDASGLSAELSVPYDDTVQLEWLSTFVEDSLSGGEMIITKDYPTVHKESSQKQFHTSSPVSVLESSSSCSSSGSGLKSIPFSSNHRATHRARSKRPRPTTFNPRQAIQFISPTCSFGDTNSPFAAVVSSECRDFVESEHQTKMLHEPHTMEEKKKKIKVKVPLCPIEINQHTTAQAVRKCLHCEITKTPQWRAGPMGPKTLCNACGVRYKKSGRLFPEYRPTASPTFVASLHSNSHKKVLQMRSQVLEKNPVVQAAVKEPTRETSSGALV